MNTLIHMLGVNPLDFISNIFFTLFQYLIQALRMFFVFIYWVFSGIITIIDFAEIVFKSISGIESLKFNGVEIGGVDSTTGDTRSSDLVYAFITNEAVQNVFWSIIALSLVLLLVFSIIAMIKSEFTLDLKANAKGPIISRALKSLVNLIAIPTISILAIFGTNFLTKTIYNLFDISGQSLSVKCFRVGAYTANRARTDPDFVKYISSGEWAESGNPFAGMSAETMAETIDEYFLEDHESSIVFTDIPVFDKGLQDYPDWFTLIQGYPKANSTFSRYDLKMVNYFYDLAEFQFFLAIGSAIGIAWIMLTVCLVLIKRVFELTILFLLAPPMIAIAPLDGGQAEKKWRQEFMKRLLSILATIFAYNMYFLLVPLFESITIFDITNKALSETLHITNHILFVFDIFFQIICVFVGLSIVKSASALLSNLLGIEDLVKSGGEAAKKGLETSQKVAKFATGAYVTAVSGTAMAAKLFTSPAASLINTARTQASRNEAKDQLAGAEAAQESAQADFDAVENDYQAAKARKDRIDELSKKGSLSNEESAELSNLKQQHSDSAFAALESRRNDAKSALDNAIRTADFRREGISAKRQAKLEAKAQKKIDRARAFKRAENAVENFKKVALGEGDTIDKEKDAAAVEAAGKGAYDKALTKSETSFISASRGRNIFRNMQAAVRSEMGEDSKTDSVGAKVAGAIDSAANVKIPFIGVKLSDIPGIKKLSEFSGSFKEMMAVDNKFKWRRLNDGISSIFGEVGGELHKYWFNANQRAKLFENVPESKKRQANIDNSMTMGARDKYQEDDTKKKERESEEKLLRRYIASKDDTAFGREYLKTLNKLDQGGLNKAEVAKLEAKIAKMELEGGALSYKNRGAKMYDEMGPGSSTLNEINKFKEEMQRDAAKSSYAKEKADKRRIEQAAIDNGENPEIKVAEQSAEQLAKAIANALHAGKGLKMANDQKIKVESEALITGITSIQEAIVGLSEALKQLNGNNNGNGGQNKT